MIYPPIVTAEEFSASTGGRIPADDPRVQPLLDAATAAVRRYCRWHITPVVEETFIVDALGKTCSIPSLHIEELLEVQTGGQPVDLDDLEWTDSGLLRMKRGCWSQAWRGTEITVRHGYQACPDVAQAIVRACSAAISAPAGIVREQAGQVSFQYADSGPGMSSSIDYPLIALYQVPWRL